MVRHYEYKSRNPLPVGFFDCKDVLEKWIAFNNTSMKNGLLFILSVSIVKSSDYWRLYIEYTG